MHGLPHIVTIQINGTGLQSELKVKVADKRAHGIKGRAC